MRAMAVLLALGVPSAAWGQPIPDACAAHVGMPRGTVAPCSGILVPPDLPDTCTAITAGLSACRRRSAGDRAECDVRVQAIEAKLAAVEAARVAERAAGQAIVTPDPGIDWSAFAWGLAVGAVVVGGISLGVAIAR